MENVITRIVEVEKECAQEVDKAERESRMTIEAHRETLEEKKAREFALIDKAGQERLSSALEEAKRTSEAETRAASGEYGRLHEDPELTETIQKKVLSLLLTS